MEWKDRITHVLDCGKKSSTLYDVKGGGVHTIGHADVLNLPNVLPRGSELVCENAHLGVEQTAASVAQPFTRGQLVELYESLERNDQKLWLFPQQSTPRACAYSGLPKQDDNDPISIYTLLCSYPEISMRKPNKSFDNDPMLLEAWEFKHWTNVFCNQARARYEVPYTEDACSTWLIENLDSLYSRLSDEARDFFKFTKEASESHKKKTGEVSVENRWSGVKKEDPRYMKWKWDGDMRTSAIYSIACTLINPIDFLHGDAGQPRVRPYTQQLAGWKYVKRYVFCFTPFHHRGGTARSNLTHHTLRWYIIDKIKNKHGIKDFSAKKCRGGYYDDDTKLIKEGSKFTEEEERLFLKYRKIGHKCIKELWTLIKSDVESSISLLDSVQTDLKTSV